MVETKMVILGSQPKWTVTMQKLPPREVVVAIYLTTGVIMSLAVGDLVQLITLIKFPKLQEL